MYIFGLIRGHLQYSSLPYGLNFFALVQCCGMHPILGNCYIFSWPVISVIDVSVKLRQVCALSIDPYMHIAVQELMECNQ